MTWLLNPRQVSEMLRIPREDVEALAREGRIPHIRLPNGAMRFDPDDIDRWVRGLRRRGAEGQGVCNGK